MGLIALCIFLFFVALNRQCSRDWTAEEVVEDSVMLLRNIVQFARVVIISYRHANRTTTRRVEIELEPIESGVLLPDIRLDLNQHQQVEHEWDENGF